MNKIKWGVIGAGGIADRRTIPGIMLAKNAELTAVMEVNMELAETIRAKYSAKYAYDNVDDLINNKEIDAIYIATPVIYHKEQCIKALKAKKHVLLEKPIAITVKDGNELVALAKENGVLFASGFMMRYHAYHQKMKEIITEGKIGDIVSCRAQFSCYYPDIPGAWRQKKETSGGGALMDMGVHSIDIIQYIVGSKAKKVAGFIETKTFDYEVEDSALVIFELENGAYCSVDANFNIPDSAIKSKLELYGTKGSLVAEGTLAQDEGGKLDVILSGDDNAYDANQNREYNKNVDVDVEFGNMYTKEIESFSNSIMTGSKVEVTATDAIQVQGVINGAYESSNSGKFIEVE